MSKVEESGEDSREGEFSGRREDQEYMQNVAIGKDAESNGNYCPNGLEGAEVKGKHYTDDWNTVVCPYKYHLQDLLKELRDRLFCKPSRDSKFVRDILLTCLTVTEIKELFELPSCNISPPVGPAAQWWQEWFEKELS